HQQPTPRLETAAGPCALARALRVYFKQPLLNLQAMCGSLHPGVRNDLRTLQEYRLRGPWLFLELNFAVWTTLNVDVYKRDCPLSPCKVSLQRFLPDIRARDDP